MVNNQSNPRGSRRKLKPRYWQDMVGRLSTLHAIYNPDLDGFLYRSSDYKPISFSWIDCNSDNLASAYGIWDWEWEYHAGGFDELYERGDEYSNYISNFTQGLMVVPLCILDKVVVEIGYSKGYPL